VRRGRHWRAAAARAKAAAAVAFAETADAAVDMLLLLPPQALAAVLLPASAAHCSLQLQEP
jgi:hypothetical protein